MDIPTDLEVPIIVDERMGRETLESFVRGYCAYMDVWIPCVGDESLECERQPDNEYDRNAVAVIYDNLVSRRVVGHVPLNYPAPFSCNFYLFLIITYGVG